jgi:imidazolonepropionase-like amidohydrolase
VEGPTSHAARPLVFANARVFDGHRLLDGPRHVLTRGNLIETVSAAAGGDTGEARVIDGTGKVLLPGLIDAHWHAAFAAVPAAEAVSADPGYLHLVAGAEAERTLRRGFTTVRDAGGPTFGLKKAIDEGVLPGPRIYPSGAFVTQTSGHGDFRSPTELASGGCGHRSHGEVIGASAIADGVDQVLRAVREQLMLGATQIKLMAGGGVASPHDPIDSTQYTEGEMRAAVEAAENWGTYVMAHAYTPRAIRQSIRAGVRCIEHGHLVDEPTAALMAETGTWWSMQPFLEDEGVSSALDPGARANYVEVTRGTDRAYGLARKHGVRLAWGSDILFEQARAARQGGELAKLARWFEPAEVLTMATSTNAELLALSGPRDPYPGRLGVIEPGALADLVLVDGDPTTDLDVLAEPDNLLVVVKDGRIYRDASPVAVG